MTYLGDPEFSDIPIERLLSDSHADELAADVKKGGNYRSKAAPPPKENHTANVSCIDPKGNACSFTSTQGVMFGSHVVIDGIGLLMAHCMSRFNYKPDRELSRPGKRHDAQHGAADHHEGREAEERDRPHRRADHHQRGAPAQLTMACSTTTNHRVIS